MLLIAASMVSDAEIAPDGPPNPGHSLPLAERPG